MSRTAEFIQIVVVGAMCVVGMALARGPHETDRPRVYDAYCKGLTATNPDERVRWLTVAAGIDPRLAPIYWGRGTAWVEKGDNDRAIQDYTRAIELRPDYAGAYRSRAAAYFLKRDYDLAWADVGALKRLGHTPAPHFLSALQRASGRSE